MGVTDSGAGYKAVHVSAISHRWSGGRCFSAEAAELHGPRSRLKRQVG